ncbi:hypothetical protein [Polaribacter sp. HL-MS24]|uniref:hypothetical protein n=1 Tax=Polaribacter sp. HL-MS24 TaxID=3077735 RepID=UPI0029343A8D|nr:hypothetical protein [Polaribacter sp. HL-MS24]WOC40023.1 hypothetical protein RRF69_10440 [Polaribacter sp. HL-MS24]
MIKVRKIDYKTVEFGESIIKMPARIYQMITYKEFIILCTIVGERDIEYDIYLKTGNYFGGKHYKKQGNVFCYDAKGALLWQWHEKGITGMRLVDQEYIDAINKEHPTADKNWVGLFLPEGQVILCHAGPSYDSLVEIATGKELDRWETR